jgi:hypothetical protein
LLEDFLRGNHFTVATATMPWLWKGKGLACLRSKDAYGTLGMVPRLSYLSELAHGSSRHLEDCGSGRGGTGSHLGFLLGSHPGMELLVEQQGAGTGHYRTLQRVENGRGGWYRAWQGSERCAGRSRTWQRSAASDAGGDGPECPAPAALCAGKAIAVSFRFKKKEKQLVSALEVPAQFVKASGFKKGKELRLRLNELHPRDVNPCAQMLRLCLVKSNRTLDSYL